MINAKQIADLKDAIDGECHGLAISDEQARAILSYVLGATPPAPAPEGWVTVPKEPTPEMVRAGSGAQSTVSDCGSGLVFAATETDIYRVMISAAPAAPVQMAPLWIKAAMCALEACEQDLGETLPDDYVLGRINESSGSPSFRIRVGHIRQLAAPATPNGWQDISTAPKDGTEILILRNGRVAIGRWNEDKYTKNPRPYWDGTDAAWQGKIWAREKEPTKWQPLPAAPTEGRDE
ncbi:hypothetical protein [Aquamicrobium sp.]|uniref:hypothetical protein n=1 Tax=Aquamicrobium sp. TaxID=1872579 RepID=UPI0025864C37|nr:hypothetical protein [Aquamicrobium sp.]MCK9549168.1 hypothetical protein [Aquamicrobium sp.]